MSIEHYIKVVDFNFVLSQFARLVSAFLIDEGGNIYARR